MAKHLLCKTLKKMQPEGDPDVINTDKNSAYSAVLNEMIAQGKCEPDIQHRQVKHLNNRLEADLGKLKRLIHPARGFKSMKPPMPPFNTLK
ncbi:MAG: hypothetical protein BWY75_00604 [bacterium ADurb.Bin425]|nr:MAG: hypothetical protein BWY75_00604 [bacterium ADurb.Bin425]